MNTYVVMSRAAPNRDLSRGSREQPFWEDHAAFIDALVADGLILLGGPLVDEGGALLIVRAENEAEVRAALDPDPWYERGILRLEGIMHWQVFIDEWAKMAPSRAALTGDSSVRFPLTTPGSRQ